MLISTKYHDYKSSQSAFVCRMATGFELSDLSRESRYRCDYVSAGRQVHSVPLHAPLQLSQVKIWVSFVPNIPSSRQFDNGQSLHGVTRNSRPFSRSMMHYKRYRTRTIIFFERAARSFILVFSKSVLLKCFRVPLYFLVASTSVSRFVQHVRSTDVGTDCLLIYGHDDKRVHGQNM